MEFELGGFVEPVPFIHAFVQDDAYQGEVSVLSAARTGFSSGTRQSSRTSSNTEKVSAADRVTGDSGNAEIKIPEFLIKSKK